MIRYGIPAVFALLLMGAHFFRAGSLVLAAACALLPLLFLVRRRIALRIMQCALAAGVLIWIHTAAELTLIRIQLGAPWLRMLLILTAVALLTGLCVLLLNTSKMKQRFPKHTQ